MDDQKKIMDASSPAGPGGTGVRPPLIRFGGNFSHKPLEGVSLPTHVSNADASPSPLAPADVADFEAKVLRPRILDVLGSKGGHTSTIASWSRAKDLLAEHDIFTLSASPELFWRWCAAHALSVSYVSKIGRLINEWGRYQSLRLNRVFVPIKQPRGVWLERVKEAFRSADKGRTAKPLDEQALRRARRRFKTPRRRLYYNWLWVSYYLGLRPTEVDALSDPARHELLDVGGVQVLRVYQSKLVALPKEERWKSIPLLLPAQLRAVELARSGQIKRPDARLLQRNLGERYTLYSGRKGFSSVLFAEGLQVEDVQDLLGHKDALTTKKHYIRHLEEQVARMKKVLKTVQKAE